MPVEERGVEIAELAAVAAVVVEVDFELVPDEASRDRSVESSSFANDARLLWAAVEH